MRHSLPSILAMRTKLILPVLALLPALAAQAPSARSSQPLPPRAEESAPPASMLQRRNVTPPRGAIGDAVQTKVIFDRPRADGPLWALGRAWKASFDGRGFTTIPFFGSQAPHNFPLRLELTNATVGGEPLALADGEPVAAANQVRTARGALTEVVDTSLESLEQSFVFDTLPNRGAIHVDVQITGELAASLLDNGLRFHNEWGRVDYTKAVAIDAAGQSLPLAITWDGSHAHMEIPASFVADAQLPLVLDPTLNFWFNLASGQAQLQHDSDVASFQSLGGRTLIVYQRNWSATDTDCWGIMFDSVLGLVQTDFNIDFTGFNWAKIAVASNNFAQNFLVVSEVTSFSGSYIVGRTISASAVPGSEFDIEREGVVGSPGPSYQPDVGSDPYAGVGYYTVVFLKRANASSPLTEVWYKQVNTNGTLVTTAPTLIATNSAGVDKPSIGKSCGQFGAQPAQWLITWQRTWPTPPFDQEVNGRFVTWSGYLVGTGDFGIGTTVQEETAPSSSSPIDVEGTRYWPVCYEFATAPGQPRDVICKVVDAAGIVLDSFTVTQSLAGEDNRDAEVDADGTRFVIARTKSIGSAVPDVEAVTVAYLPSTGTFRVDERSDLATAVGSNHAQTNVCADFSGGNTISPRYFVSFTELSNNTFRLVNYGGWVPGPFFTTFVSQCGTTTLSIAGDPVIGQTLTFNVSPGPLSAVLVGTPSYIPLTALGCNCYLGVNPLVTNTAPWSWTIPNNPAVVGFALSAQGFHITGTQCLGFIDVSDTLDFTIR
jgi:hypothetical protein